MTNQSALRITIKPNRISRFCNVETAKKVLHEEIEIKCFYEGNSTLLVGSKIIYAKAGDVVVINPYEFHTTLQCSETASAGKYHLFMIPLDYFKENGISELDLRNLFFEDKQSFQTLFTGEADIYSLLNRCAQEYLEKDSAYSAAIHAYMTQLFVILLRKGIQAHGDYTLRLDHLRSYHLVEPALRYIRDHYSESVELSQLVEMCCISKHHFCRTFKNVAGKTAMDYLRDYRLQIADTLLTNKEKSIAEIAELCGFESSNYFCRCFKNYFGSTPGKRRKSSLYKEGD